MGQKRAKNSEKAKKTRVNCYQNQALLQTYHCSHCHRILPLLTIGYYRPRSKNLEEKEFFASPSPLMLLMLVYEQSSVEKVEEHNSGEGGSLGHCPGPRPLTPTLLHRVGKRQTG